MSEVRVVQADFSGLLDVLKAHAFNPRRLKDAMEVVAESLVAAVDDKFEESGPGWQDLAESTKLNRRGSTYQILVDTSRMRGSIRGESGDDYAEAATDTEYAGYHVSDRPRTKIPLRDFFDLDDSVYEDAAQTIVEELTK